MRRLRALWREARDRPRIGLVLKSADRAWWARTIRHADIVDLEFVRAQMRAKTARAAIRAYVRGGFRTGLSLNPLFLEQLVSSQLSDAGRVPALYAYLVNDVRTVRTTIAWDARAHAARFPRAEKSPGGPLGHAWRTARATGILLGSAADGSDDRAWDAFARTAGAALGLARGDETPEIPLLQKERVLIVRVSATEGAPDRALELARSLSSEQGVDVVVALDTPRADVWVAAGLLTLTSSVVVTRDHSIVDRVVRRSLAEIVAVRGPDADVDRHGMSTLLNAAQDGPVAPLWLGPDGTMRSAGIVQHESTPVHLLAGHPREDAERLGPSINVAATAGTTFARPVRGTGSRMKPRTLTSIFVIDPMGDTRIADEPQEIVELATVVSRLGWTVQSSGPRLRFSRRPHVTRRANGECVPSMRWALKIVAPPGRAGEAWGDTHFARGVADALRRLGQEVVIDSYDARTRESSYLDDVVLALRGPQPFRSQTGAISILWIISHPDEITAAELHGFDAVFASSVSWPQTATTRFRTPIRPLLQCTDPGRFHPTGAPRTDDLVFVGTARGIPRPSVLTPIEAGINVSVYGPDWRGWIPESAIAGRGVPNTKLSSLYESAGAVLNDHWPAMRDAGFISNRLFDVVAAGGRAISDDVAGIDALFGGAVRTYRTSDELIALVSSELDPSFPDASRLRSISEGVREQHSFDSRARSLLDEALRLREQNAGD